MALTDFSGAFAPPNKLKAKSLLAFAPPSFDDDSNDLVNTHTTGESPTNAAYLPPGSRPTSNPTVSSAYTPPGMPSDYVLAAHRENGPSGSVTAPSLGQQTRPDLVKDIYAPQLNDVTSRLNAAYQAPHAGLARQILGGVLTGMNPRNPLGGLVSGETQRQRQIEPLQQEYGLLSNAIGAQRASQLGDANLAKDQAETNMYNAHANAFNNPKAAAATKEPNIDIQAVDDLTTRVNPDTGKNYTPYEAAIKYKQDAQDTKPDKVATPNEKEQAISDYLQGKNLANTAGNRDKARSVLATRDRPAKDPDIADINKQLKEAQLDKALHPKPTVAEQNRADLADNLNENLDVLEDIVKRRPELFGPINGRITEAKMFAGSNDPDIAKLRNVKHQGGMAQISSHGMRSAQGIEGAANALMDFHNGPDGILGSIGSARSSVKVFKNQVDAVKNPGGSSTTSAPTSGAAPLPSFADWKKSQQGAQP